MRCLRILMVLAFTVSAVWACAADTAKLREVYIFKGDDPALDGIELGSWGGGSASKSKERILDRSWSVKITIQGLYAGGRMDFTRPVTLLADGIDDSRYIQFAFFVMDTKTVNPAAGTIYDWEVEPYTIPTTGKIRFVFESDKGVTVSAEQPTRKIDPDDNWMRIAVPLARFKVNEDLEEFRLKRLLVMSDLPTTMYLGEMKLLTDKTPITVESLGIQAMAIMDEVLWVPETDGGVSCLKYSWDFDARNGIQSESDAMIGRYVYTEGGTYTVTLTVSDLDGLKAPVTVSTTIDISG